MIVLDTVTYDDAYLTHKTEQALKKMNITHTTSPDSHLLEGVGMGALEEGVGVQEVVQEIVVQQIRLRSDLDLQDCIPLYWMLQIYNMKYKSTHKTSVCAWDLQGDILPDNGTGTTGGTRSPAEHSNKSFMLVFSNVYNLTIH